MRLGSRWQLPLLHLLRGQQPHSFLCEDDGDVGDAEVKDDVDVGDFEVKDDDDEGVDDDGLLMVIPGCQSPQCVKKKKMRAPPKSLSMLGLA